MHYIHWGFEYAFFQDHLTSLMIYRVYSCLVWGNYSRKSTTRFLYKMSIKNGGNLTTFEYGFQSWMKIDFKPNPFITLHRKWRRGSVKKYQPHFRGGEGVQGQKVWEHHFENKTYITPTLANFLDR